MRVASKAGNLPFEFGQARLFGSRIIRYVRDGRTDGRTKATLIAPFTTVGGIKFSLQRLSVLIERFNSVLLDNSNVDDPNELIAVLQFFLTLAV